jgi:D-alanyl-D-alanine carboxypeptidase (penicillin-binding protein 5/6)
MKSLESMLKRWIAVGLACVSVALAHAQPLQPPEVAARNYLVIDLNAGQVLAERDADKQIDPASLTKLMTAYLVFNALKDKKLSLEQTLPVSSTRR